MFKLDVLLVPLQGVYDARTGRFHCEYPDRDVYARHVSSVPAALRTWGCDCAVLSGGHTQGTVAHLSEAAGASALLGELGQRLPRGRLVVESAALDSVENVLFGLMAARLRYPDAPLGRVVILPAWAFKKRRFSLVVEALGIADQCYVCGMEDARQATDAAGALKGERTLVRTMLRDRDPLLVAPAWEAKRRARDHSGDYRGRVGAFRRSFPACFAALDRMREAGTIELLPQFRTAFHDEVIKA